MSDQPFFSIVIPTYNRAHLILKTLETVLKQTFKDFEIIVIDNASTDNTAEVLSPLVGSNAIRFIVHDRNYERAQSRNTGMMHARGRFVTFLDSDDLMYPDNLKDAFDFHNAHEHLHIFHNLYELVNEESVPIYHYRFHSIDNPVKSIAQGNFLSCIGVFISHEIFSKFRFDTHSELQGMEDWEFWIRILARYEVGRIDKMNSGIVHHGGRSLAHYEFESYLVKKDYVMGKIKTDPTLMNVYAKYLNDFECSCYMLAASQANTAGFHDIAWRFLQVALRKNALLVVNLRFLRILQISFLRIKSKI